MVSISSLIFSMFKVSFTLSSDPGSGTLVCSKKHVFYEGDFQKLAFRSRVEPIGPEKDTKQASKMTPVGDTLAPLSNGMRVSENHPRKTHAFYSKVGSRTCSGHFSTFLFVFLFRVLSVFSLSLSPLSLLWLSLLWLSLVLSGSLWFSLVIIS